MFVASVRLSTAAPASTVIVAARRGALVAP